MRIYLAGPMRGYPEFNFREFASWAKVLRAQGYKVVSPAEMDQLEDMIEANDQTNFVMRDLVAIMNVDAVVTLPGWEHSVGARAEVAVAHWLEKPVLSAIVLASHKWDYADA